jgi:hypothetical protein
MGKFDDPVRADYGFFGRTYMDGLSGNRAAHGTPILAAAFEAANQVDIRGQGDAARLILKNLKHKFHGNVTGSTGPFLAFFLVREPSKVGARLLVLRRPRPG